MVPRSASKTILEIGRFQASQKSTFLTWLLFIMLIFGHFGNTLENQGAAKNGPKNLIRRHLDSRKQPRALKKSFWKGSSKRHQFLNGFGMLFGFKFDEFLNDVSCFFVVGLRPFSYDFFIVFRIDS